MREFKHLTYRQRVQLETLLKLSIPAKEIAEELNVHISTVYREMKRGLYTKKNSDLTEVSSYSAEIAHNKYKEQLKYKGAVIKLGSDHKFATYIERKIIDEKYSPSAVLGEIIEKKIPFDTQICVSTLYSYIDKGIFLHLTNKELPVKCSKKKKYNKVKGKMLRRGAGTSIEKRPTEVNERNTFGHWEMDCVVGKRDKKATFLVFTERLTRYELIVKIDSKTTTSVVSALNKLEKQYKKNFKNIFKTITVDNGSEFMDYAGMEKSIYKTTEKRTEVYYCHPYASCERGSNENANKFIRRFYPKGCDITKVTKSEVAKLEKWINTYPRKMFGWKCAEDMFNKYVSI